MKLQIILLIYAKNLIIIDAIIIAARYVKRRLDLINESKQIYILED